VHPSLEKEGFIHCSLETELKTTAELYFKGVCGLLLLTIDPDKVLAPLKYEYVKARDAKFPHIFGPINVDCVLRVEEFVV